MTDFTIFRIHGRSGEEKRVLDQGSRYAGGDFYKWLARTGARPNSPAVVNQIRQGDLPRDVLKYLEVFVLGTGETVGILRDKFRA